MIFSKSDLVHLQGSEHHHDDQEAEGGEPGADDVGEAHTLPEKIIWHKEQHCSHIRQTAGNVNSMSAMYQFEPNFKGRFLGSTTTTKKEQQHQHQQHITY